MVFEKTLTAMVKGIRAHRGKENEYINSCLQEIQKEVTSKNLATKSMAVLKLSYLNMLGYDMSWSSFAVVEVMSHNRFMIKRPGYLASSICFNANTDVGLLTINLFKKDFGSKSQYESGMALTCLSSICSPEISRDLIGDLVAMLSSSRPYLRKKTILCLYRVFLTDPQALRTCFPKLKERLGDEDQGVLTACVNIFLELARKNAKNYLSLVPQLYHILVNTTNNWLSIKLLKVFQLLCPLEPRLPAKMVEPLTNLLNSTKAQSVEFEAIRCTVMTMPEGTPLMSLAIEKLQTFLNSSDRNLRYLALEICKEILTKQYLKKLDVPDLHAKVLESIEESDTTARRVALQLLDRIVTPSIFAETVKKLMEFSKHSSQPDEFYGTILRMGERDRYALVEDFAWYLLILAEMARNVDSAHAEQIAEQMVDISVRVSLVRPYAAMLSLGVLDKSSTAASDVDATSPSNQDSAPMDVAMPVIGACAYMIGEFHDSFDAPAEVMFVKAAKTLLVPKQVLNLDPAIQTQCVWAATKLYLGAPRHATAAIPELQDLLVEKLPSFIQSTHVDVAERAALALHLVNYAKGEADKITAAAGVFEQPLLPIQSDAQASVPVPGGLDLDEPFFPVEAAPQEVFAEVRRSDPTDPYQLAANYKDDLGFLTTQDAQQALAQPAPSSGATSSMFYLQSSSREQASGDMEGQPAADGSGATPEAKSASTDPLEQMREKLAAARASGGVKYEVFRDDVKAPGGGAAPAAAGTAAPAAARPGAPSVQPLLVPAEKELTDLQGRLWSMCFKDDNLAVYVCVQRKNLKKQSMRIDLRCERIAQDGEPITGVSLKLPAGISAQEADTSGLVCLVPSELQERSSKVKVNLSLANLVSPTSTVLNCEVHYSRGGAISGSSELQLPATAVLVPCMMGEDDVAEYMSQRSGDLVGVPQTVSFPMPDRTAQEVAETMPTLVGRCAGLCNFYGIQHAASEKGQKFLLISQPPVGNLSPEGSRIICLCAGMPKDGTLDLRITVKSNSKEVSEDVGVQLVAVLKEIAEGRLRIP